jgi:hypothetical protein
MDFALTPQQEAIRDAAAQLCAGFPAGDWRGIDERREYLWTTCTHPLTTHHWIRR